MASESRPSNKAKPSRKLTVSKPFGTCNNAHDPVLSVSAGVPSVDALVCAVAALQGAYATNAVALEQANEPLRSLLTATENSLEKGLALTESVLAGLEQAEA